MDKARREALENLIADEVEAINGYEKRKQAFTASEKHIIDQIIEDEKKHVRMLINMYNNKGA